jgi:ComF family protein
VVTAGALLEGLLALTLAPACAVCDALLDRPTAGPVCALCWARVTRLTPPLCDRCGDPRPTGGAGTTTRCRRCRTRRSAVGRARAVGPYEGRLREIIHLFKYDRRATLARPLATLMRQHGSDVLGDADWVVPVPLHPRRRRARGFNQAAELAHRLGPPVLDALKRTTATPPQMELPAARRHQNVRGAFAVPSRRRGDLRGARVVLVDDVATTGATLEACGQVLRACGVREIRALTLTKVVRQRIA